MWIGWQVPQFWGQLNVSLAGKERGIKLVCLAYIPPSWIMNHWGHPESIKVRFEHKHHINKYLPTKLAPQATTTDALNYQILGMCGEHLRDIMMCLDGGNNKQVKRQLLFTWFICAYLDANSPRWACLSDLRVRNEVNEKLAPVRHLWACCPRMQTWIYFTSL